MGSVLCEHCAAACCRYIALPIDKPTRPRDYDDIRWYLMHEGVSVFVEEGDWYIQFQTACSNLGRDNLCLIYEHRPEICREYEPGSCDYVGGAYGYEHLFTRPKHIDEYYRRKTGRKLVVTNRRALRARPGQAGPKKGERHDRVRLATL